MRENAKLNQEAPVSQGLSSGILGLCLEALRVCVAVLQLCTAGLRQAVGRQAVGIAQIT